MDKTEFLDFFKSLFDEGCNEDIAMDTEFRYLDEWSSLAGFYFLTGMKQKYNKSIEVSEFKACETIEDLYNLYQTK